MTPQSSQPRFSSLRAIFAFIGLTFTWSWGLGFVSSNTSRDLPTLSIAARILAGFGPSLAGVVVAAFTLGMVGGREWLTRCLNGRVGWRWTLVAFVTPLILMVSAIWLKIALGGVRPNFLSADKIPLAILNFGLVLLVGGPVGEEFGWRGYLTPALTARMNWRAASLLIGLVWGAWHLPLFFSSGTLQAGMAIPTFLLNILAGSVLFGWLFQRTRPSVVPCLVLHTSLNAWSGILAIIPTKTIWLPYVLVTGLLILVAIGLLLLPDQRAD